MARLTPRGAQAICHTAHAAGTHQLPLGGQAVTSEQAGQVKGMQVAVRAGGAVGAAKYVEVSTEHRAAVSAAGERRVAAVGAPCVKRTRGGTTLCAMCRT